MYITVCCLRYTGVVNNVQGLSSCRLCPTDSDSVKESFQRAQWVHDEAKLSTC